MSTFDISSISKGIESWTHLMGNGFAGKLHGADLGTFEFSLVAMILCLIIVICGLLDAAATIITSMGTTSFQGGFTHKSAEHYESLFMIAVADISGNKKPLRLGQGLYTK